jgi:phage-related tail fiber protein
MLLVLMLSLLLLLQAHSAAHAAADIHSMITDAPAWPGMPRSDTPASGPLTPAPSLATGLASTATAHQIHITSEDEASTDEAEDAAAAAASGDLPNAAASSSAAAGLDARPVAAAAAAAAGDRNYCDEDDDGSDFDAAAGDGGFESPRSSASYASAQSFRSFKSAGAAAARFSLCSSSLSHSINAIGPFSLCCHVLTLFSIGVARTIFKAVTGPTCINALSK